MESEHFSGWHLNDGASDQAIAKLKKQLSFSLPTDYLSFLREHDGGEGFLGQNYLMLWKAEELVTFNREYEVSEYAPGLFLFGSDGGGEAYAFDTRSSSMNVVRVPFIGMDLAYATPIANGFSQFLSVLTL
ncbi:SMI1/KNR4 family protein [Paraburkholderia terrae]|uniref:SMI1/KNR4 family protein n=1 Tax=Paraburkholderia terrae TaxID=311230 RepID=A0A2I8F341_9BURK|nr:SMI1/KNR4 family protein [Paraburkholderia terrae]AUT66296.1 SMI1/KNR4 family protein [Paraburkholderia terrae]